MSITTGPAQQIACSHPPLHRVPARSEVADVARAVRRAWGLAPASRLDVDRICERFEIEVSVRPLGVPDGGAQGFLIPKTNGRFAIEIDPEPPGGWKSVSPRLRKALERHRKRFLIAHELAHTLFYENTPNGPERLVLACSDQEAFCDELARALLVPQEIAARLPFAPESVVELQRRFDVSMEVALRAVVTAHPSKGVAWLLLQRPGETVVQWTSAERNFTSRAISALRVLAMRASYCGHGKENSVAPIEDARALHLPRRRQVVVTWTRPVRP